MTNQTQTPWADGHGIICELISLYSVYIYIYIMNKNTFGSMYGIACIQYVSLALFTGRSCSPFPEVVAASQCKFAMMRCSVQSSIGKCPNCATTLPASTVQCNTESNDEIWNDPIDLCFDKSVHIRTIKPVKFEGTRRDFHARLEEMFAITTGRRCFSFAVFTSIGISILKARSIFASILHTVFRFLQHRFSARALWA